MMNVFGKVKQFKESIFQSVPQKEDLALMSMVQKLANSWHYKRTRKGTVLSKEEAQLYEVMIMNHYNPLTVYSWLLLVNAPSEVRYKLKQGEISLRNASKLKAETKELYSTTERELVSEIINCVERYIVR